jgi:YD repeat-containing protein
MGGSVKKPSSQPQPEAQRQWLKRALWALALFTTGAGGFLLAVFTETGKELGEALGSYVKTEHDRANIAFHTLPPAPTTPPTTPPPSENALNSIWYINKLWIRNEGHKGTDVEFTVQAQEGCTLASSQSYTEPRGALGLMGINWSKVDYTHDTQEVWRVRSWQKNVTLNIQYLLICNKKLENEKLLVTVSDEHASSREISRSRQTPVDDLARMVCIWETSSTTERAHFGNRTRTCNSVGRVLSSKDELGNVMSYTYDALGQLTNVSDTTSQVAAQRTSNFSPSVTWFASVGTITNTGVYTAPAVTNASVTITATSVQDSTKSGSTTITVNPIPSTPTFIPIPDIAATALGRKITPVDLSLYVQGGTAPYTFAIPTQTSLDSVVCSVNGTQLVSDYGYHPGANTVKVTVIDTTQKSPQTTVNINVSVPKVAYQLYGIDYSPYVGSQDPNFGTLVSNHQVIQQIGAITPYVKSIRTFGCTHGLENVARIAKRFGLKVFVGVWIGTDPAANNTEAENNPAVVSVCDFVFANYYPHWEGADISSFAIIVGNAVPPPQNAAFYFLDIASWAQAGQRKYFYFEAHDEPWKGPSDDGWGIWNQNMVMKPGMIDVFDPTPPLTVKLLRNGGASLTVLDNVVTEVGDGNMLPIDVCKLDEKRTGLNVKLLRSGGAHLTVSTPSNSMIVGGGCPVRFQGDQEIPYHTSAKALKQLSASFKMTP